MAFSGSAKILFLGKLGNVQVYPKNDRPEKHVYKWSALCYICVTVFTILKGMIMAKTKSDKIFFFGDAQAVRDTISSLRQRHTEKQLYSTLPHSLEMHHLHEETEAEETFARCKKADGYVIVVDLQKPQKENDAFIRKALHKMSELGFSGWRNIIGIHAGAGAKTDLSGYLSYLNTRVSEIGKSSEKQEIEKSYSHITENIVTNKNTLKFYNAKQERSEKTKIIEQLEQYIEGVESRKKDNGNTNYQFGFWFFTKSQGLNRKVNCLYAQKLKELLEDDRNSIEDVFDNPNAFRDEIIAELKLKDRWNFFNVGMNSKTLQSIFDDVESYLHKKQDDYTPF